MAKAGLSPAIGRSGLTEAAYAVGSIHHAVVLLERLLGTKAGSIRLI
jgi:hypothetical protein